MRFCSIAVLVTALMPLSATALPWFRVRSVPVADQMSSESVRRVFQDSDGFMWFGTLDGLYRYDGHRLLAFRNDYRNHTLLSGNEITHLAEDSRGNLLVGTRSGLDVIDRSTCRVSRVAREELDGREIRWVHTLSADGSVWVGADNGIRRYDRDFNPIGDYSGTIPAGNVNSMYEDGEGNLWIMIWREGLFKYIVAEERFERFPPVGSGNNPFRLFCDDRGNYWIGTWGDGLFRFFPDAARDPSVPREDVYRPVPVPVSGSAISETNVFSIAQDDTFGYIWFISYSGLYALRYGDNGAVESVDLEGLISESNNIYSEIVEDRTGNLWVGTFSEGVFMIDFDRSPVRNLAMPSVKAATGVTPRITVIHEDRDGELWINQDRWGFGVFDPSDGGVKFYREWPGLRNLAGLGEISCIAEVDPSSGEVWVGAFNSPTIYAIRKTGDRMELLRQIDLTEVDGAVAGNPRKIFRDRGGNVWIATTSGLLLKRAGGADVEATALTAGEITDVAQSVDGTVWIATRRRGLFTIDESADALRVPGTLPSGSHDIGAMCADGAGRVWIGTGNGSVIVHDAAAGGFRDVTSTLGITLGAVLRIAVDNWGQVWISTNRGVVVFNPDNFAAREYSAADGDVLVNSFLANSHCKNAAGEMLFGGNRGISVFTPTGRLLPQTPAPRVRVSDVKTGGVSVFAEGDNRRYDVDRRRIVFDHRDRNIEFDLSALNYRNPRHGRYSYRMSGVDNDWVSSDGREFAIYNRLKTGRHTFSARAMDENGLWSPHVTTLEVYMRPTVWETWWMRVIYILAAAMLVRVIYRIVRNRIKLVNSVKIAQIEKDKSEELTQVKLSYFTNISHDFLTPLTILSCLVDDAEMTGGVDGGRLVTMRSNIVRLRRLLQQVLDFRKMESGNMSLRIAGGDIAEFIRRVCAENFTPLMRKKSIDFSFDASPPRIEAWFDADKIDKIVFNLLSNAYKYTPEGGRVAVEVELRTADGGEERLAIRVRDTGVGIAPENLQNIFTRFYFGRVNDAASSNSIGLSLTKDLVELHHGTISVESRLGEGSLFTVDIPTGRGSYTDGEINPEAIMLPDSSIPDDAPEEVPTGGADGSGVQVLVVEDNEELRAMIAAILSRSYSVTAVRNGVEALAQIAGRDFHIVISDVMMPGMDGLELCRRIKGNIETSHIPVIMLTAKNSTEDRVECYEAGADGYIAKPFELKVLHARIRSFLAAKRVKRDKFLSGDMIDVRVLDSTPRDEEFLKRVIATIEANIADSEFDIGLFADALHLSKSTLYRKLKTMTGLSPVEFIRHIRLKTACGMLRASSMTVSEVAYAVGFSDPNYFSLCFRNEFDTTPTEYKRDQNQEVV